MSAVSEPPNVYEDLQIEDNKKKVKPCNCRHGWLLPVGVTLLGVVCFAAGFVISYFAVPCEGKIDIFLYAV